jgi:hypothetical protein
MQGRITIEVHAHNPSTTVLEWHGPNDMYLSGTILTAELKVRFRDFLERIEIELNYRQAMDRLKEKENRNVF